MFTVINQIFHSNIFFILSLYLKKNNKMVRFKETPKIEIYLFINFKFN